MIVQFYHSRFCPRCLLAGRALNRIKNRFPGLVIETVEVTAKPREAFDAGIRLIPALKSGDRILTGAFLTANRMEAFFEEIQQRGG